VKIQETNIGKCKRTHITWCDPEKGQNLFNFVIT